MSLRPLPTKWFELLTVQDELARVLACLSETGAVELEARSRPSGRLLFPGLAEELGACRELVQRYGAYWPPPAAAAGREVEDVRETLRAARSRLTACAAQADPIIASIENRWREMTALGQLREALEAADVDLPNLQKLTHAGPELRVLLAVLPSDRQVQELPALVLVQRWQTPESNYVLAVGRALDINDVETQLRSLKAVALPLPEWLPASPRDAIATIGNRLAKLGEERTASSARLQALSVEFGVSGALADIALIEWLNDHAKDLYGSDHLAWVTGWTSDVDGTLLRRALDRSGAHYLLRLLEAPTGVNAPLVLHNPVWARAFEVFPRLLGGPARFESDPSQILAVIASSIFGFMFGDVGQGAVIAIVGIVLGRRMPLLRMLVPGGLMAVLYGVLFGSVFCREDVIPALWIRPMQDPVAILLTSVMIGIAIMTLGLLLDAVQMHWRGEARGWWAQRAGLLATYAGLLMSLQRPAMLIVAGAGAVWFIIGAGVLAPRGRLRAMADAVVRLAEETLRILVNTISFVRIGAFALGHAGLSLAIVGMAQASGRVGYGIVLVLGNIVVIVLEGLVVGIQTTRLLLFEFFIRFLTATGREFKPLSPPAIAKGSVHEQI